MKLFLSTALALYAAAASCSGEPGTAAASPATPAPAPAATTPHAFDHTHALWDAILRKHVHGDAFDYAALKADHVSFDRYLAELHAVTPDELASWSREQRFAFWINAYNAHTIAKVIEHYPIDSIRKLDKNLGLTTVFEQPFIPMDALHPSGKPGPLSLNDIEHEILRKRFQDARVHAAINCASASCPPLRAEAFVATRLDEQLDEQMRAFVNDPKRNKIDPAKKKLRLSAIFDWFAADFERDAGSVRAWLERWTPEDLHPFLEKAPITYLDYDWALNDVDHAD